MEHQRSFQFHVQTQPAAAAAAAAPQGWGSLSAPPIVRPPQQTIDWDVATTSNMPLVRPTDIMVHRDVFCNVCSMAPILGVRYKCAYCADFDLCSACEARGKHEETHPLLKLVHPLKLPTDVPLLNQKRIGSGSTAPSGFFL